MSTLASSRKRASTPSSPSTSLSKKLKLTIISPPQPISPAMLTTLLNQDPADLMPDLRMQVTCLKLFLLVIARMPENTKKVTPKHKREHEIGYRQAVEALNKLDILGIATKKMIAAVNDIEKLTKDIDEILEFEAPSFPHVQLKRSCEDFMGAYEERLASLDPMRENGCDDTGSHGEQEMARTKLVKTTSFI